MYNDGLVVSLLKDNKTLRETAPSVKEGTSDAEVILPFDSTYKIRFKNTKPKRCRIEQVLVDGKDILDTPLVVFPYETSVLEGGFYDGHQYQLKFVKTNEEIKNFRNNPNDGEVQITFRWEADNPDKKILDELEKIKREIEEQKRTNPWRRELPWYPPYVPYPSKPQPFYPPNQPYYITCNNGTQAPAINCSTIDNYVGVCEAADNVSDGFTVRGEEVNQNFINVESFETETKSYSITFHLRSGKALKNRTKVTCDACGTKNSSRHKYCFECGNNLRPLT